MVHTHGTHTWYTHVVSIASKVLFHVVLFTEMVQSVRIKHVVAQFMLALRNYSPWSSRRAWVVHEVHEHKAVKFVPSTTIFQVVHATCHVAFRKVHEQLAEPGRLETTIELFHDFLKGLGYSRPRIALAGLNPHCGDGDIYGKWHSPNSNPGFTTEQSALFFCSCIVYTRDKVYSFVHTHGLYTPLGEFIPYMCQHTIVNGTISNNVDAKELCNLSLVSTASEYWLIFLLSSVKNLAFVQLFPFYLVNVGQGL